MTNTRIIVFECHICGSKLSCRTFRPEHWIPEGAICLGTLSDHSSKFTQYNIEYYSKKEDFHPPTIMKLIDEEDKDA